MIAASSSKTMLIQLVPITLPAGDAPTTVKVDVRAEREKLLDAAGGRSLDVTLELDDVEAEKNPGVYYEVYVGLPKGAKAESNSRFYVGNIALYGTGIRSEARGDFRPASFSFVITGAIRSALRPDGSQELNLMFVPRGGAASAARIERPSICTQPRLRKGSSK